MDEETFISLSSEYYIFRKQLVKNLKTSKAEFFNSSSVILSLINLIISPKEKDDDFLVKISDGESMIEKNSQKDSPNGKKNSKEKTVNTSSGIDNLGK